MVALEEAIEIGRRTGVVHISHLKGTTPQEVEQVLADWWITGAKWISHSDVYPYQRGSTMLNFLLVLKSGKRGRWKCSPAWDGTKCSPVSAGLDAMGLGLDKFHIAWTASWDNSAHHGQTLADYVAETGRPAAEAALLSPAHRRKSGHAAGDRFG